jgi:hypothetical protein
VQSAFDDFAALVPKMSITVRESGCGRNVTMNPPPFSIWQWMFREIGLSLSLALFNRKTGRRDLAGLN